MNVDITEDKYGKGIDQVTMRITDKTLSRPDVLSQYRISRIEARRMRRQLDRILGPEELNAGIGMAGEAFHERLRENETAYCRRELSKLKQKLGQIAMKLDAMASR